MLRDEGHAAGSGVLLHLPPGQELALHDLVSLMISISDNTATNVLIDLAGMDAVAATMASLGVTRSTLGRPMKERPARGDERENWATPDDYAAVTAELLDRRAASPAACEEIVAMLERQQCTSRISRYLPNAEIPLRETSSKRQRVATGKWAVSASTNANAATGSRRALRRSRPRLA